MFEQFLDFALTLKGAAIFTLAWIAIPVVLYGLGQVGPAILLSWLGLIWALPLAWVLPDIWEDRNDA